MKKRIFIAFIFASMTFPAFYSAPSAQAQTMAPDGTYVGGRPQMAPDGTYVGGRPQMAPDGTYVGGRPQMAPDGTYIGR